jgi:hypothetical protein
MSYLLRLSAILAISVCVEAQTATSFAAANSTPDHSSAPSTQPQKYDPLLDPPPLPHTSVTLIGGIITKLDPVMNQITIRPFGGKRQMRIAFDTRTQIYDGMQSGAESSLQKGQRVYVDTMLNGTTVFAKTVQIETQATSGSGRGQIIGYDSGSGTLIIRDELSDQPARFRLSSATVVRGGGTTRTTADLVPGTLVSLTFGTQQGGDFVKEVSVLAKPGSSFSFFGKITYVDLSRNLVAVDNQNDDRNYEIHLAAIPRSMLRNLHEGMLVSISAEFDGSQYLARDVSFPETKQPSQP